MGLLTWLSRKTARSAGPAGSSAEGEGAAADEGARSEGAEPLSGAAGVGESAEVAALAEDLSARDGGRRVDASRALLDLWREGDGRAAAALAERLGELLRDPEPLARLNALAAVRLLRRPENLSRHAAAVQALLADPAAQVRTAAVAAAARLPGDEARERVRGVLGSSEEPMRFQAACVLAELHDSAALPELAAALRDGVRRQEALSALLTLGDAAALPAVGALFEDEGAGEFDRTLAAATLARLGDPRGAEHLAARIAEGGDDAPVAAEMAGRLGAQEAVPALWETAGDARSPARGAALRALGRLRAPGAEEKLLALAADAGADGDLRMDAAEGLAEVGSPAARELLQRLSSQGGELGTLCAELLLELSAAGEG